MLLLGLCRSLCIPPFNLQRRIPILILLPMHSNVETMLKLKECFSLCQGQRELDFIPIDSCNKNLTNAFDDIRSIIGTSNYSRIMTSIFKCDKDIFALSYVFRKTVIKIPSILRLTY